MTSINPNRRPVPPSDVLQRTAPEVKRRATPDTYEGADGLAARIAQLTGKGGAVPPRQQAEVHALVFPEHEPNGEREQKRLVMKAMEIVRVDGMAYEAFPRWLQEKKGIAFEAIRQNDAVSEFLPESFFRDPASMRKISRISELAFSMADEGLRSDADFVLDTIPYNIAILPFIGEELKENPAFAKKVVSIDGLALEYLPAFQDDEGVVLLAVKQNGAALEHASDRLQGKSNVVEAASEQWSLAYKFARGTAQKNRDLLAKLARKNVLTLQYADEEDRAKASFQVKQFRARFGEKAWKEILYQLLALDITFPQRFESIETLFELIKNRLTANVPDGRPLAVVIYPKTDWNTAFEQSAYELQRMTKTYRVLYYEVSSDEQLVESFREATSGEKASLVKIGGHGVVNALHLGEGESEDRYLDTKDVAEMKKMMGRIEKNGHLVLLSCSTGYERDKGKKNLANFISRFFPAVTIYAPILPDYIRVLFDEKGFFYDVRGHTKAGVYRIRPRTGE